MMTELELRIKDAAQKYYTDGSSPLTDAEFDALVDELKATNPDSELLKTGWGYDVKVDSTPGQKVKHKYGRAGSLEKCHNWKELKDSFKYTDVDISLKLDGISCVLYFDHSKLKQALTRGDGDVGIDITDKVSKIFPTVITSESNFTGAVRGELLMTFQNFEKFSAIHPEAKNPRNSTAGIINAKEWKDDIQYISLVVYTIVGEESEPTYLETGDMRVRLCEMFGIENVVPCLTTEVALSEDNFMKIMNDCRDNWYGRMYPADGLVITQPEYTYHSNGEITYNACAFKFPAESKEVEVQEVLWEMSKTRYAIPKLRINTVQLSGTNVSFCTGFNAEWIKENGIGKGAIVEVQKSGEIIPVVTKVINPAEPDLIDTCPVCGSKLEWNGVHLQCNNPLCSNAITQDTLIWIKNIAPKDGLGDLLILKMLELLITQKVIHDIRIESVMECDAILSSDTESAQKNLFAEMWNDLHNKKIEMVNALLALNIPRIGGITALKLSMYPDVIDRLVNDWRNETRMSEETYSILSKTIGVANADAIDDNFWKISRLEFVRDRISGSVTSNVENKGKVAITGKLSVKRSDFEAELRKHGYTPGDISKDSKFLITDSPNSSSSKNAKADAWGIKKITEQEFRALYL